MTTMDVSLEQEMPVASAHSASVTEALVGFIRQRERKGIEKYGTSLMTFNGRDAVRDILEEDLDRLQYTMQMVMEQEWRQVQLQSALSLLTASSLSEQGEIPEVVAILRGVLATMGAGS